MLPRARSLRSGDDFFVASVHASQEPIGLGTHVRRAMRQGLAGHLPSRYGYAWKQPIVARAGTWPAGSRIIDIGSGRSPVLVPAERPPGCHYAGLDISTTELAAAPSGSYDATITADLLEPLPAYEGSFDFALSFLVLEHVKDIDLALARIHSLLAPGGVLLAQLAGGRSASGWLNRLMPHRVAVELNHRLTGRPRDSVFPAHYDRCTRSGLIAALGGRWSAAEVTPIFAGGRYWEFSRPLLALYLAFEEWTLQTRRDDLATFYFISATR